MIILKNLFMIFFHHFWPLSRKSVAFSRKTLAMLLYLCFTSPKRYFDENFFFIEKLFSRTLLDKGKFIPVFWQKLFDNVVKTAFSVSIGIFWGIKSSKKIFFSVILGQAAKKILRPVAKFYSARLSKLQSTCPKKSFGEIFFFRKNENFLNVSWQWVKNHRRLARIFFLLLGCQNCNLSFYRNNLCFFESYPFKFHRWTLSKRTRNHGKNYSARLLILHSTCP